MEFPLPSAVHPTRHRETVSNFPINGRLEFSVATQRRDTSTKYFYFELRCITL
jgi:hypothetical protein